MLMTKPRNTHAAVLMPWLWVLLIALFAVTWNLAVLPLGAHARGKPANGPPRFHFDIDSETPLEKLMPIPKVMPTPTSPWLIEELAQVPEVLLQAPRKSKVEV